MKVLFLSDTGINHNAARIVANMLSEIREPVVVTPDRENLTRAALEAAASEPLLLPHQTETFQASPRFVPGGRKRWRRSQRAR